MLEELVELPIGKFGTLRKVDLRLLWPNEAYDFTPWLANNLDVLGEVLGMDLELRLQEAPVGSFSLDLLVHDLGSDSVVIIENQIEQTNHDHLGKLLTYAAGHDAAVVVWIASEFRDTHRQALDWLNQRTDATTGFFGVVVEALQIDDSLPACNFRLVASPNDWSKAIIGAGIPSPNAEAYRSFFQILINELRDQHHFTKAQKAQAQNWYQFSSGRTGVSFALSFAQGNRVRAELYIDRGESEWNDKLFGSLLERKEILESKFGVALSWEPMEGKRATRIAAYRKGAIDEPTDILDDIQSWSISHLLKFREVFMPHVIELVADNGVYIPEASVSLESDLIGE